MPICTLRQKIAVIEDRRKQERLYTKTIAEWQTRTLAQFIAATVPTDKGKTNKLAQAAEKIRLRLEDDEGAADDDTPMDVFIEEGSKVAENPTGSFERLTSGFGGRSG